MDHSLGGRLRAVAGMAVLAMAGVCLIGLGVGPAEAGFPGGNGKIAHERGSDIWIMRADGSEQQKLIAGSDPAWSPDGTQLAFSLNGEIYVWKASGVLYNMTATGGMTETYPAWSPDAAHIAYERGGDVWLMDTAGLPNHRVWISEITHTYRQPAWSPDGTQILAVREPIGGGDQEIYAVDASAPWNRTNLTNNAGADEHHPEWAPGGTRIAYIRAGQLWVMAKNGTGQNQVTSIFPHSVDTPSWAPDVSKIAVQWVSGLTANWEIYAVNDHTWTTADLTNTLALEADPSWGAQYPPLTKPDAVTVAEGGTVSGDVLANDTDVFALTQTVEQVGAPAHGTVSMKPGGPFTYTHDGSETLADSFTYKVKDGPTYSAVTTVSVTVTPVDDPLIADTVGLVDPEMGMWHLRQDLVAKAWSFYYGNPGDVPFVGDWNCDGTDTPGLFRQTDAYAYLRNANSQGIADIRFFFGNPSDIPLAGDFDGDGCDSLSIYRPSEARFYIINALGTNGGGLGAADYWFDFGDPGDKPVVGDWDGDGIDEVGLHRESTGYFYYRITLSTGIADAQFFFGDPGDRFVAGDWGVVDGTATPAVYRPADTTFYFRTSNTAGPADYTLGSLGPSVVNDEPDWLPVAGLFWP